MQRFNGAQVQQVSTPGNIGIDSITKGAVGVVKRVARTGTIQEFCVHLAAQNDYAAGQHYIFQGAGDVSSINANLDWGADSSFSSFAAMQDYMKSNKMVCDSIRIVTDDVDNWNYKLIYGLRNPANRRNEEQDFNFQPYSKSQGDGLSKTIYIDDFDKDLIPLAYLAISNIKVSTFMKFYFNVREQEISGDYTQVNF